MDRKVGEYLGSAQGSNICPQVEQERKLHPQCWGGQGSYSVFLQLTCMYEKHDEVDIRKIGHSSRAKMIIIAGVTW